LARVHLPGFGERHEGVRLVVAEFRVRARADEDGGNVSVRQGSAYRPLEALFEEFVGEHYLRELNELHGYVAAMARGLSYVTM
jgi:hypothetical protein